MKAGSEWPSQALTCLNVTPGGKEDDARVCWKVWKPIVAFVLVSPSSPSTRQGSSWFGSIAIRLEGARSFGLGSLISINPAGCAALMPNIDRRDG